MRIARILIELFRASFIPSRRNFYCMDDGLFTRISEKKIFLRHVLRDAPCKFTESEITTR